MLLNYSNYCCLSFILLSLVVWGCAGYAYRVNAKRPADHPKKKDFEPVAVLLAPVTWPLFFFFWVSLFLIKALFYGVFLVLFTIALIAFPESTVPDWLDNKLSWIGNKLLDANTFLLRMASGYWDESPRPT